jgi:glycyl-tRNA synthetase beta chain
MGAPATLAIELVTEELPPKALKALGEAFARAIADGLARRGFLAPESAVTPFATPRRLAVAITHVRDIAPDKPFKEKLLPVSVAFDAQGKPTPALLGKLKARQLSHVDPSALLRESDGKVEALFYADIAKGGPLVTALQAALDEALETLPIPKVMSYQRPDGATVRFVRPAHRLLALHGEAVVDLTALGLDAGRLTDGHRFLSRSGIEIRNADAYEETLRAEGKVVASFSERRERIVAALAKAAGGATIMMPDALLDEVTALVEWPAVYAGTFDRAFLEVPQECLVLTMQQNQKYFALTDAGGRLVHRFLVVSNIETQDPAAIVQGNERVLHARLADARFFFDQDRKVRLADRVDRLKAVVYHNKLGTQHERVQRIAAVAGAIAAMQGADGAAAKRAAQLAKADLVTDMVGEFPELQGLMGRYYAEHDGEAPDVAAAIEQHYWPRFAGDSLPQGPVAQCVALADKLDALVAIWGIGLVPTGEKDPFGLRRHALGIVRMLLETPLPLSLPALLECAAAQFPAGKLAPDTVAGVAGFIHERLRHLLREQGYSANEVEAVLCDAPTRIDLVPARLLAVREFAALPEAGALAAANKRIVNILRKSASDAAPAVDRARLADGAEHDLWLAFQKLEPLVDDHCARNDYAGALLALASAKPVVDRFFDDVMVMADDPAIRANRLALLRGVAQTMNRVADISKLAV